MEHEKLTVVETGKVGGPDKLLFALFVEIDAVGHVGVSVVRGEGLLDSEVGNLALREVAQHTAGMREGTNMGMGVDTSHRHDPVQKGGKGVNDLAGVTLEGHMGWFEVSVRGFNLH